MREELVWQDEVEVILSLVSDKQLMEMREQVEVMVREEVYRKDRFPLSCGGLRMLQATMMWAYWGRRGKGIRLIDGRVEVCELEESPFYQRYSPTPSQVELGNVGERDEVGESEEEKGEWV